MHRKIGTFFYVGGTWSGLEESSDHKAGIDEPVDIGLNGAVVFDHPVDKPGGDPSGFLFVIVNGPMPLRIVSGSAPALQQ
jgi:hypothetical protein